MASYLCFNGPMQTTGAPTPVATAVGVKTMQQIKPLSGIDLRVKSLGVSFDAYAAAQPGIIELIETDVAATVTAYVSADITKYDNPGGPAADAGLISLGTAASGYTATAEGTITVVRTLALHQLPPTGPYEIQWAIGDRGLVQAGKFLRVRVKFFSSDTPNVLTWLRFGPDSQD